MIDMDEQKHEIQKRAERLAQAAAPAIQASAEALQPVFRLLSDQFKRMAEQARRLLDAFAVVLPPRRRRPHEPCTWCSDRIKRPATHTVKWREPVVWWDEFDNTPTYWPAGRTMRMCEFHAAIAERYNGVRAYRFRRLT